MCFALSRPGAPTCLASGSVRTGAFGFHLGPKGFFRTENMITENMISCFRALFMRLIVSHYGFSNTTISTICLGRSQTIFYLPLTAATTTKMFLIFEIIFDI